MAEHRPSESDRPEDDELLDAFVDGRLPPEERARVQRMIDSNPRWGERVRTDEQIGESLRRMYGAPPLRGGAIALPVERASAEPATDRQPASWKSVALLALAASIAWIVFAAQLLRPGGREIAFTPRPLAEVYRECVDAGFEPYWICDDEAQFAATFERRQGVPLRLASLPPGTRMLGLAYLGGLSRDSTAMLAEADGARVVVFVDRLERDWGPKVGRFTEQGLTVWRAERDGLVFYEVSPLGTPALTEFLEPEGVAAPPPPNSGPDEQAPPIE